MNATATPPLRGDANAVIEVGNLETIFFDFGQLASQIQALVMQAKQESDVFELERLMSIVFTLAGSIGCLSDAMLSKLDPAVCVKSQPAAWFSPLVAGLVVSAAPAVASPAPEDR